MLFAPGDDAKKLAKAAQSATDCVILELEDGVALNRKDEARVTVVEALRALDFGNRERVVRVNAIGTPFFREDMLQCVPAKPDAILVPKVETAADVQHICATLGVIETAHGLLPTPLIVMIESALGVMNLREIAQADSRLAALIFGAEDLASSIGAKRTCEGNEVFYARSAVVIAAAAYGLQAIDMVFTGINDAAGLAEECNTSRQLGFAGKTLIHPSQIEMANRCFSPTDAEVAHALRIVEAFRAHQVNGAGVFALDGKMVDMPVVRQAERVLAMAALNL